MGIQAPILPPAPWTNVIANPDFGCLTTESGLGYTWSRNSQMNRLTPWSNDPVSDAPGEVVYLRDNETGEVWTPTPLPLGGGCVVAVRHGQGQTVYESRGHQLDIELTVFVPLDGPVKLMRLRLINKDTRPRHLSATYFAELVMGSFRDEAPMQLVCSQDSETKALLARKKWADDFGTRVVFAASSPAADWVTADRAAFLGRHGSVARPAALARQRSPRAFGASLDPCAALTVNVSLAPGASEEVLFVLGEAAGLDEARRLVHEHTDLGRAAERLAAVARRWEDMLTAVQVTTPDVPLNLMLNSWLPYQVLSCRLWARTSNYQSGGAYGFRDQLQDVMALVHCAPRETRDHILRAASRQFEEGDVQHWWHPPSGIGVRTRMTDDLYFLPFVVHHYVTTTGDLQLLDEQIPFLTSPVLSKGQDEAFGKPETTANTASVYDHCVRALEHGFRLGRHGLPLMGTGDWNDGMNKVGAQGKGESVWNGWFFLTVLELFATLSEGRGDAQRADWCRQRAESLRVALELNAWDGAWYRRAYFDDGTPLGSSLNDECRIDAIPQAWAVISGKADKERAARAMQSVYEILVRPQDKLIKLFDPPFDRSALQPGYIKGYVPGIRENGGQYTHAATWVVWATALLGDGDRAFDLWNLINPISHGATKEEIECYKVEPYVVAADVYGAPPHTGRGGWTWYTGSASWLYRIALEAILGVQRRGSFLEFQPCVPKGWPRYEVSYRFENTVYRIVFDNAKHGGRGVSSVVADGEVLPDGRVPLKDDGRQHDVRVTIGG